MNEFQALTSSASLAVLGIILIFIDFGDDDDDGGGKMIPLRQVAKG